MHPSWNFTERIAGCGLVTHTLDDDDDAVSDSHKNDSIQGLFPIATIDQCPNELKFVFTMTVRVEICRTRAVRLRPKQRCVVTANKSAAKSEWAEREAERSDFLQRSRSIISLARPRSRPLSFRPSVRRFASISFSPISSTVASSHSLIFRVAGPDNFD